MSEIKHQILQPPAIKILKAQLPQKVIDQINDHIDQVSIPKNIDHSQGLVGQINRDNKSAQITFDFDYSETTKNFQYMLNDIGTEFLKNAYRKESKVEAFEGWSIHSYEGDYNPLHDHGVNTDGGFSCIIYLKVPDQIKELPEPSTASLTKASGTEDGMTNFHWGHTSLKDFSHLREPTSFTQKPTEGTMLLFPNWLAHSVNPFFGEGERRTFSANFNIYDYGV